MVVTLLLAMRAAVNFHYQPHLMTIEVDDVWWERMLPSEMDSEAIAAQLLPYDAFLKSHLPAQFGNSPQQLWIDMYARDQGQPLVMLAYRQWSTEHRPYPHTPSPPGKGKQKKHLPCVLSPSPPFPMEERGDRSRRTRRPIAARDRCANVETPGTGFQPAGLTGWRPVPLKNDKPATSKARAVTIILRTELGGTAK